MDSFTLNASQRAALQAAIARRAKAARLEHYRRQAELAAVPDYFQHMEHAARFVRDLRAFCADMLPPRQRPCFARVRDEARECIEAIREAREILAADYAGVL